MIHHISIAAENPQHVAQVLAEIFQQVADIRFERIGVQESWRVVRCRRGGLVDVLLEFWVENRLMLELVPPEMMGQFLAVA